MRLKGLGFRGMVQNLCGSRIECWRWKISKSFYRWIGVIDLSLGVDVALPL